MVDRGRMLVLGGSGLLGESLRAVLAARGMPAEAPTSGELDLTDERRVTDWVAGTEPRAVIDAAAYTDVTKGEEPGERQLVFRLNRDVPAMLARICRVQDIPFLFVSTDFVFGGGAARPYREDDVPRPVQVYGESKLAGERAVIEAYPAATIVRTSTLFGPGRRQRMHYVDAVLAQAARSTRLEVVRKPVASPTYTPDLAHALLELLSRGRPGVWHVVNHGACSRLELAEAAVRASGLAPRVEVVEREEPSGGPRRPPYSVLDSSAFEELTGSRLRSWRDALDAYLGPVGG